MGYAKITEVLRSWMWHHYTFNRPRTWGIQAMFVTSASKKNEYMQFREGSRLWCPGWCPEKWQISLGWLPFSSCSQKRLSTYRKLHRTFSMQVTAVGVRGVCVMANKSCVPWDMLFSDGNLRTLAIVKSLPQPLYILIIPCKYKVDFI